MKKFCTIRQHNEVIYDVMNIESRQDLTNISYDELLHLFGGRLAWAIAKFYAYPSNNGKNCNIVLTTDGELNRLEKIAKEE